MSTATRLFGPMRVPFLALTLSCVLLGVAAARHADAAFAWPLAAVALVAALAAHVSVNAFNEYLDFRSGLDATTRRTPFSGGSGVLPADPAAAPFALATALFALGVTVAAGLWLVSLRGAVLLPLGLLGVALVLGYTSWITRSPWLCLVAPGLGFGPLMVVGTAIAVGGQYDRAAGFAALVPFFLVNALLLLNQFPDVEPDRAIGRRHLAIVQGRAQAARVYAGLVAAAYVSIVAGVALRALPWTALAGLATAPLAWSAARAALAHPDDVDALLPAMGRNVVVNLATPALLAAGLFLGRA
ncbi:MAG: prenyltransferase [Burkholderiales bacterium]|nr:prenyltransferase [Burkholderiales bacterium]